MRKTELLEIGCLEATKKMLKFSKKEEKKSRKQRLQKKMKMRKFEYEVSVRCAESRTGSSCLEEKEKYGKRISNSDKKYTG